MFLSSRFSWVGEADFITKIAWNNQKMHCKFSHLAIWKKSPPYPRTAGKRSPLYIFSLYIQTLSWPCAHLLPHITRLPVAWVCHCQLIGISVVVAKQSKMQKGLEGRHRPTQMASAEIIIIFHKLQQRKKLSSASGRAFHFEWNGSVTHGATFSFRAQCCANKTNGNFVIARKESRIWLFRSTHNSSVHPGFNF